MRKQPLRQLLRQETDAVHQHLHARIDFASLQDGTICQYDYDNMMARLGGFYSALDPQIFRAVEQIGAAVGPYRYQPRSPMFPQKSRIKASPHLKYSLPALAGAAYVIDGSVLGGRVLGISEPSGEKHPYWAWCAREGSAVWRGALALIDLADTGPSARAAAVDAARELFNCFDLATAPPARTAVHEAFV